MRQLDLEGPLTELDVFHDEMMLEHRAQVGDDRAGDCHEEALGGAVDQNDRISEDPAFLLDEEPVRDVAGAERRELAGDHPVQPRLPVLPGDDERRQLRRQNDERARRRAALSASRDCVSLEVLVLPVRVRVPVPVAGGHLLEAQRAAPAGRAAGERSVKKVRAFIDALPRSVIPRGVTAAPAPSRPHVNPPPSPHAWNRNRPQSTQPAQFA